MIKKNVTFIDLFCGIGGFHRAMKESSQLVNLHAECVFSSDIDKYAQKTYYHNYNIIPIGDITQVNEQDIPSHDFLFAGFPCQAFSVAGYRKGFEDTRGTLFFDVARIAKYHNPQIILLENVKGLVNHDKGNTFKTILNVLENDLGYYVQYNVLNTSQYSNIPHNRERIYIVASKKKISPIFPDKIELTQTIKDMIETDVHQKYYYNNHQYYEKLKDSMQKDNTIYQWRRHYVRENKNNLCPTLTANMGTGGHNVPLVKDNLGIRKLTPNECLRFQGFDENFSFPDIPESQKYKQIGNSITVKVVREILNNIFKEIIHEI